MGTMAMWLLGAILCVLAPGCVGGRTGAGDEVDLSEYPGPFTILCRRFAGPYRSQEVLRHLEALEARKMEQGYTVEDPAGTLLYYGQYEKYDGPEATRDLSTLKQFIYGDTRQRAFPLARMIPMPKPPEEYYPLVDAPSTALYSLQIAVFYGPQNEGRTRQESAILLAKELREKDKLDAFVHHGVGASVVCVGAFPPSAIETQRRMPSISTDPQDLVQSDVSVEDLARLTKVVDPRASSLQKRYPHMFYNGGEKWQYFYRFVNGRWTRRKVYSPSLFVMIPGRKVGPQGQVEIERILP